MPAANLSDSATALIFCPNLAVDHIIQTDGMLIGQVQHVRNGALSAGGKGLNVARAARCLGSKTTVVGLVGGRTGHLLRSLLAVENIEVQSPKLAHETRIATVVHDSAARVTTVLNEPGPSISAGEWLALTDLVKSHLAGATVLVCTGSLLPGIPDDGYVDLIETCRRARIPVIVDASGATLRCSAQAQPDIVKSNLEEAELAVSILPDKGTWEARAVAAAQQLSVLSGATAVVTVSCGAALVHEGGAAFVRAPEVVAANEVGAGDAFLAGLMAGLSQRGDLVTASKRAVAVASASVETPQPGHLDENRADELEKLIVVDHLPR